MHLNRDKTQKNHRNSLINFPLQSFSKNLPWFKCSGKEKHLNLTARQNPAANPLTANALQDFQQLRMWFRSLAGQECRGMQMHSGGTSGRGIHQTRNRTAHASEPELNSKNPLQHIERLSVSQFQQARPLVQMRQKRGASEPCRKAESGSQPTRNKCVANSQQMRCKIFNNYTHGSDPWRVWNTTDCKYTLEALWKGVSTKRATNETEIDYCRANLQLN